MKLSAEIIGSKNLLSLEFSSNFADHLIALHCDVYEALIACYQR